MRGLVAGAKTSGRPALGSWRAGRPGGWRAIVDRWPYLMITAAMAYAWRATLGASAHIPFDLEFFHFPLLDTVQQMISAGIAPTWDPGTYGGVPMLANAQSAFAYPPHLLLTAWYSATGGTLSNHVLSVLSVIHVWIAGLGTVFLVRSRGWGNPAAAMASAVVCLCGSMVLESQHLGMAEAIAWLPWAAAAADRCAEGISWGRVCAIAMAFFLVLSSGFLPMVIPWALVLLALASVRGSGAARSAMGTIAGLALGVLLGAVVLLPIYALRRYFPPLDPYNTHTMATLVTSVYPNAFGYWVAPSGAATVKYAIGDYMYIGGVAVILIPLALARGRTVAVDAALALAVLVLSIGPVGEHVAHGVQSIPTFGVLYRPALLLYAGVLPVALFLARGLQRRPSRVALAALVGVVVALAVIPISDSQGHTLRLLSSAPRRELFAILAGALAVAVAAWQRTPRRWAHAALAGVAILGTTELASTIPARFFTNSPGPGTTVASTGDGDIVKWLHARLGPGQRVIVDAAGLPAQWAGFSPLFGLPNANGFQPQFSRFQQARVSVEATGMSWRALVTGNASFGSRILPVTPAERGYFEEMGVKYVIEPIIPDHFHGAAGYTLVLTLGDVDVYRVDPSPSRAWILAPGCIPSAEQGVLRPSGCVTATVDTTVVSPHTRRYELGAGTSQLLITGEPYYPGWSAQAGSRTLPVRRLGYLAAITVPAGVRTVTMDYSPPGFLPGLVVSLITAIGLAAGGIVVHRRDRRAPGAAAPPSDAPQGSAVGPEESAPA